MERDAPGQPEREVTSPPPPHPHPHQCLLPAPWFLVLGRAAPPRTGGPQGLRSSWRRRTARRNDAQRWCKKWHAAHSTAAGAGSSLMTWWLWSSPFVGECSSLGPSAALRRPSPYRHIRRPMVCPLPSGPMPRVIMTSAEKSQQHAPASSPLHIEATAAPRPARARPPHIQGGRAAAVLSKAPWATQVERPWRRSHSPRRVAHCHLTSLTCSRRLWVAGCSM